MFFGIPYEFSVGITSPSSAGGKLQELELQIKSPENSFEDPSACLQFEFEIVDRLGRAVENWRESNLNERNFD